MRRRCAYLYLQYPDIPRETAIIRAKRPNVNEHLAVQVAQAIHGLYRLLIAHIQGGKDLAGVRCLLESNRQPFLPQQGGKFRQLF